MAGVLALVGGNEWQEKCTFDRDLLEGSGGSEVVVLPTAAAYEHPERSVEHARGWFEGLGGTVRGGTITGSAGSLLRINNNGTLDGVTVGTGALTFAQNGVNDRDDVCSNHVVSRHSHQTFVTVLNGAKEPGRAD